MFRIRFVSIAFLLFSSCGAAALSPSSVDPCDYQIRGPILPGIAAGLPTVYSNADPVMLCLGSTEGDLAGALELFDAIWARFITYVPAGWNCEGACAIAFLAGGQRGGSTDTPGVVRSIHPEARLSFFLPEPFFEPGASAARMREIEAETIAAMARLQSLLDFSEQMARPFNSWHYEAIMNGTPDRPRRLTRGEAEAAKISIGGNPWWGGL